MAFLGDLGKTLGLGSTTDVLQFAANAGASYASGGVIPIQTSPFEREEQQMADLSYGSQGFNRGMSSMPTPIQPQSSSFLGGLGQSIGSFGRDVGGFFQDISPLTSLFGGGAPTPSSAGGSARTLQRMGPEETSTSGELFGANLGLAGPLMQAGRSLAISPSGQALFGGGLGLAAGALVPSGNGMPRITRRMKSDVRKIYMMAGMDPNATAQILNNLGTYPKMNFDAFLVFAIISKRFRNDGPVVTKAAVRKTKTTLRRMKGVVDMYNSVCKPTTRRAPARRAAPKAVQLIKN